MTQSKFIWLCLGLMAALLSAEQFTDVDVWFSSHFYDFVSRGWLISGEDHQRLRIFFYDGPKALVATIGTCCVFYLLGSLRIKRYRKNFAAVLTVLLCTIPGSDRCQPDETGDERILSGAAVCLRRRQTLCPYFGTLSERRGAAASRPLFSGRARDGGFFTDFIVVSERGSAEERCGFGRYARFWRHNRRVSDAAGRAFFVAYFVFGADCGGNVRIGFYDRQQNNRLPFKGNRGIFIAGRRQCTIFGIPGTAASKKAKAAQIAICFFWTVSAALPAEKYIK